MKKIKITNNKGQKLSAIIHEPTNQTNKILIFSHSFKSNKDIDYTAVEFAKLICNEGYAFLRFDYWGSGESDGKFEKSNISTHIDDLKSVIEYAKTKGYKDICLIGLSLGTTTSIMAYDESIKCLLLWSPIFHHTNRYEKYKNIIDKKGFVIEKNNITGKKFKISKNMLLDYKKNNPVPKLKKIKCPVLAILGSKDNHITKEKAQKNMSILPCEHRLIIIDGGDHNFLKEKTKKKVIKYSNDFIKKHL